MPFKDPLSVHFVGSIPLASAREVSTTIVQSLPAASIKRLSDGETGERYYFVGFQHSTFERAGVGHITRMPWDEYKHPNFTAEEVEQTMQNFPKLETAYDTYNIESYRIFQEAKAKGGIEEGVKFQACLPTPAEFISADIQPEFQAAVDLHFEAALIRATENLQNAIPHEELAVQIDLALVFALLEGAWYEEWAGPIVYLPLDDKAALFEKLISQIVRIAQTVAEDVDLGFHFCYGDAMKKHFVQPKDLGLIVRVAMTIMERLERPVQWLHMPVPKGRTDEEYFAPLRDLLPKLGEETGLYLGVVHEYDPEGTRARLEVARKVVGEKRFGISTECGLARRNVDDLKSILEIERMIIQESSVNEG